MKNLTPTELQKLLETHEPQTLLAMHRERLDEEGFQLLEKAQAEEALAATQLRDWNKAFKTSLPPVPERPWSENRPPKQQGARQKFRAWMFVAAVLLLSLLPLWHFWPIDDAITPLTRQALPEKVLVQKKRQLLKAWTQYAEALIRQNSQTAAQDDGKLNRLTAFYLDLAVALEPDDEQALRARETLRHTMLEDVTATGGSSQQHWDQTKSPPRSLVPRAQALHRALPARNTLFQGETQKLFDAYLGYADFLTEQARSGVGKDRAAMDYRWAALWLELANTLKASQPEILIRLIGIKEALGLEAEANALTQQLNKILAPE